MFRYRKIFLIFFLVTSYKFSVFSTDINEDLKNYKIKTLARGLYTATKDNSKTAFILKPKENRVEPFGKEEKILTIRGLIKGIYHMNNKDYFLIPYFKGVHLKDFLSSFESSLKIKGLISVCHELSKIHDLEIIHGDMHSGNYLINQDGEAFIFDHDWSIVLEKGQSSYNIRPNAIGSFPPDKLMTKGWDIWMLGDSFAFSYNGFLDRNMPIFSSEEQISGFYDLIVRMKQADYQKRPTALECKETLEKISIMENNQDPVNFIKFRHKRAPQENCIVM